VGAGFFWRPAPEAESEARLMLKQVIAALRRQDRVHDWQVRQVNKTSTQAYVIGSRPESHRQVTSEHWLVSVMNDHTPGQDGEEQKRGEAQVTLQRTDLPNLSKKLADAVFMASLANNPRYELPGMADYPDVALADGQMRSAPDQLAQRLVQELTEALAEEKDVRLSSAEVFVEEKQILFENSRGATGSQVETELLLDFVLLATGRSDEMESHIAFERRRAADLDVPGLARRQAQFARDAIRASAPRTGTFNVVVSDDALAELLMGDGYSPLLFRSSAQARYQRMSPWEVGKSIFPQQPSGDSFTLYSNALLPFGSRSSHFNEEGLPSQRVPVVEQGTLSRFWATNRYAQYLHIPPTADFGNMEIAAGTVDFEGLLHDSGSLYHIVAFSAMSPDPITGDFVGEIRLGYEITKGETRPIRGGSISGNLLTALGTGQFSREIAFLGNYLGPRAMRFPQITVAGA
jgi:predicted Zn-dependent protease